MASSPTVERRLCYKNCENLRHPSGSSSEPHLPPWPSFDLATLTSGSHGGVTGHHRHHLSRKSLTLRMIMVSVAGRMRDTATVSYGRQPRSFETDSRNIRRNMGRKILIRQGVQGILYPLGAFQGHGGLQSWPV